MNEFLIEAPSLRLDRNSPEEKSAFQERMSKARDLALGGLSPRAAGEQRVQKILHWVYSFEKSTIPSIGEFRFMPFHITWVWEGAVPRKEAVAIVAEGRVGGRTMG